MNKYNIYNLNWTWLGTFWSGENYFKHNLDGDFYKTNYSGCLCTPDGKEYKAIEPINCYIKFMVKE